MNFIDRSFIGWGLVDEHSAATLQEAEVVFGENPKMFFFSSNVLS